MKITIIKPKTMITMKPNNFTFHILPFSPSRFTLRASPFFPAAGRQEFPVDTYKSFMQNEPNFQTTGQTITLVMAEIYNDNKPLVNQKTRTQNDPKMNKKRIKTNENEPNSTPKTTQTAGKKLKKLAIALYIAIITGVTTDGRGAKILDCNESFANIGVQRLDYGRS